MLGGAVGWASYAAVWSCSSPSTHPQRHGLLFLFACNVVYNYITDIKRKYKNQFLLKQFHLTSICTPTLRKCPSF